MDSGIRLVTLPDTEVEKLVLALTMVLLDAPEVDGMAVPLEGVPVMLEGDVVLVDRTLDMVSSIDR